MNALVDEKDGIVPNIFPVPNPVGSGGTLGAAEPPIGFPVAIDALNGFAAPPPVSCGLKPTPVEDGNVVFLIALKEFTAVPGPACPFIVLAAPVGCCLFKAPNSENPVVDVPGLL